MGIIAAMEELDEGLVGDESAVEQAETAVEVAQGENEVQEQNQKIEADVADIEDGMKGSDELQALGEVAADAVESGEGLPEEAAQVATIAIEAICNRLGFKDGHRVVPATESFGQTNTRLASTKMVVESIGDKIKAIWNAIAAMGKRLWDKVVQIFNSIFGRTKGLQKHLESLKTRVEALDDNAKPKNDTIDSGNVLRAISRGGKANVSSYVEIVESVNKLAAGSSKIISVQEGVLGVLGRFSSKTSLSEEELKEVQTASTKAGEGLLAHLKSLGLKEIPASEVTVNSLQKVVIAFGYFADGKCLAVYETFGHKFADMFSLSKNVLAKSADVLLKNEMKTVIKEALDTVVSLEKMDNIKDKLDKMQKEGIKAAETVSKNADKMAGDKKISAALKEFQQISRNIMFITNMVGRKIPSELFRVSTAGANYVSASLAQYRPE